jgi:tetratricopeptide (TPR) repeat protein
MEELLAGLVPGLPADVRGQILARAEGVPLYAVETVRMLLDRGLLVQEGAAYQPVGEIGSLEVPETLHALIAARLDGLSADERRLLQDGAVLGKTFSPGALAALGSQSGDDLQPLLAALVRKEVLGVQADPRSPEHGQYGFLQDLVRHVAYETLSKRERRTKHLAAATHLSAAFPDDDTEVVEVIASHYLDAYRAAPDDEDAAEIKRKAYETLVRAGARAASLGAAAEARRYYEESVVLTEDPLEQAELLARAGDMAGNAADTEGARALYDRSIAIYETEGDTHSAARVSGRFAYTLGFTDHRDEAAERMERAFEVIKDDEPDLDLAVLAGRLSRAYWFFGDLDRAEVLAELALDIGETQRLPEALALGLRAKAAVHFSRGRPMQALALTKQALEVALEHDLLEDASTGYFLLSDRSFRDDRYADALRYLDEALALARRQGSRPYEWSVIAERTYPLLMTGRWDEVLPITNAFTQEQADSGGVVLSVLQSGVETNVYCGELDEARRISSLFSQIENSSDLQDRASWLCAQASLALAEGRLEDALAAGEGTIETAATLGYNFQGIKQGVTDALEAALALGDSAKVDELLAWIEQVPPSGQSPYLEAQGLRFRARVDGDPAGLAAAAARFRGLGVPFWEAVAQLEQAEALGGIEASPLLVEARSIFERLGAVPWLERCGVAAPAQAVAQ